MAGERNVWVPAAKLVGYLLSLDHPVGGPKARLLARFGYDLANASALEAALIDVGRTGTVVAKMSSAFGEKIVIDGTLATPSGRSLALRTVWLADGIIEGYRLITAYPR